MSTRTPPLLLSWALLASASACAEASCSLVRDVDALSHDWSPDAGPSPVTRDGGGPSPGGLDGATTPDSGGPSEGGAPECRGSGGPAKRVGPVGREFCIDATEVTRRQYDAFLKSSPAVSLPECAFKTAFTPANGWPYTSDEADLPVVWVDWCDAYAYCAWAGKRLCGRIGGGELLDSNRTNPSENEWFHACTHNGQHDFSYGDAFVDGACDVSPPNPYRVGSKPSCEGGFQGLYDMSGNVFELIDLCPTRSGAPATHRCIAWGGSFDKPTEASCSFVTNIARSDRFGNVGFRCCGP